jgi:hypothetical protein
VRFTLGFRGIAHKISETVASAGTAERLEMARRR